MPARRSHRRSRGARPAAPAQPEQTLPSASVVSGQASTITAPVLPVKKPDPPSLRGLVGGDWRRDALIAGGLALISLALYLWRLNQPGGYVLDEVFHAFTALRLVGGDKNAFIPSALPPAGSGGLLYEWTHPALAKILTEAGIVLLGQTPYGWRLASAVFGAVGVSLCFLLGRVLFNRRLGLVAAALLLVDGLWFVMSRTAMNDIFVATFLLLVYLFFYLYLRLPEATGNRFLWLTGVAAGLAFASKWSAAYPVAAIGVWAIAREIWLYRRDPERDWIDRAARLGVAFVLVPAGIYVLSYAQMFALGDSSAQFIELQAQMYHSDVFFRNVVPGLASAWWIWPLARHPMPLSVEQSGSSFSAVLALGNPVIWWAFVPAIAGCVWYAFRERSEALWLVLLAFLTPWLPWAVAPRGTYLYYFLPSVPAGCLAIAYLLNRVRLLRLLTVPYLVFAMAAFVYLYPIFASWPLSKAEIAGRYWLTNWHP
jgi:dolichyl-phosphate-mannose-protein mannosyltransferase